MSEILKPKDFESFDRVTDILAPFSGILKIDPMILQRAALRGTLVHNVCDNIIKGLPYDDEFEHEGYIQSFIRWKQNKSFLNKPVRFYDTELSITGECDGIYEEDGKFTLFDLKTPASEGKTWSLQGTAYAYLARKQGFVIDKVEFIKLSKKGSNAKVYEYKENFQAFLECLNIYRRFFKNAEEEVDLDYI